MIKKFGVRNFTCFNEGIEIDFTFDKKVPNHVSRGSDFTTVLGVKGANGSGKTNILKAISFLNEFCCRSADTDKDKDISLNPYRGSSKPTDFYTVFNNEGIEYCYELSLDRNKVFSEKLYRKDKRKTLILHREGNEIVQASEDLKEIQTIRLRSNASVISMWKKFEFKSPMLDLMGVYTFFLSTITNVSQLGYLDFQPDLSKISESYLKDKKIFEFLKRIIITADSGIKDIEIEVRQDHEGNEVHLPYFVHNHDSGDFRLTFYDESSGTQTLYKKIFQYWVALDIGAILALDEFDIHLHALVLPKILELFLDPEINTKNAQFIFTAHNTEIIDQLGKYRTILVNKENNESYCYRLDEIPGSMIRNDRPISPIYLKGKIGGVPFHG